MIEPILKIVEECYDYLKPWQLLDQHEEGVVLRWGKHVRTLKGGKLHWKWPVAERVLNANVNGDFTTLREQSLRSEDGKTLTVSCIVQHHVHNIEKALLKIQDFDDAIVDACTGAISAVVADNEFEDMNSDEFLEVLKTECHARTVKFGVTVDTVSIENLCETIQLRHYGIELGE